MGQTQTTLSEKNIVLFDGVCNLCNGAVNFLIDADRKQKLHFASLQSEVGQRLLEGRKMDASNFDTFVFISDGHTYTRSRAALEVMRTIGGAWSLLYILVIVPAFIRDAVYSLISRNRYRWFGKRDSCRMPTPELKSRFV
jgi:predicted DCC family thiol-disulfide oxidoreductase YuxK